MATWTTAYINNLPDSAFAYIEEGGQKDDEGKTTPRSLRHFPYKDESGKIDADHVRDALGRIPQSSLSAADKATAMKVIMAAAKQCGVHVGDEMQMASARPAIERRTFALAPELEERDDARPLIRGHAAVFNSLSENLGMFREVIRPGAFADVTNDPDTRSLINHNEDLVLGRVGSGTLRLREDQRGLYQETDPPDTTYANDLLAVMRRNDVNQQSFGFIVAAGGDNWRKENGEQIREVTAFKRLTDVSIVTYPAYRATDAVVRSLCEGAGLDFEGLSAAFVKHFRGEMLSTADRDVIRRSLAAFTDALNDPAQERGEVEAEQERAAQAGALEHLTRRLRLASIS